MTTPSTPASVLAEAIDQHGDICGSMAIPECADLILAAMPDHLLVRKDEWERVREAARAVVDDADPDEGFEGYIDYLVPAASIEALRTALGSRP